MSTRRAEILLLVVSLTVGLLGLELLSNVLSVCTSDLRAEIAEVG